MKLRHCFITLSQDWVPKNFLELSILFLRRFMILQYKRLFVLTDERQIPLNALRGGKRCNLRSCFSCMEDFYIWPTYVTLQGFFKLLIWYMLERTPGLSLPTINQKNNNHKINMIHKMNRLLSSKGHIFNNIKINEFDSLKRYY